MSKCEKCKAPAVLPEPAIPASQGVCCGNFTTGAHYMGQAEQLCCGNPDDAHPAYYTEQQVCAKAGMQDDATRDKFEAQYLVHIGAGELPDDVRAMVLQRNGDVYAGQPGSRLNLAWQAYQWGMQQQYIESQHKLLTLGPGFYGSNWVGTDALKAIAEACK